MEKINWKIEKYEAKYFLKAYIECELSRMEQKGWEIKDDECLAELQHFLLDEIVKVADNLKENMY